MSHNKHQSAASLCPACDIGPFTRNHYFTGKLLVERDFTDEQRYYVEKLRHHHQRLHGWGVVCGLKVKEHESQACRDRFVCVEPGTAIDCCGHELIVGEETCLDITQTEAIKKLKEANGDEAHTLQICIRYRECPTEDIPVLYDECGCDDTQCAPNRILESFELDVILDPKIEPNELFTPRFQWENSTNQAHAFRVALHEGSGRLYVMTTDGPGAIYQLSTSNHTVLSALALPAKGIAMAVSNDGTRLYVVCEAATDPATTARQLHVFDTADLSAPGVLVRSIELDDSVDSKVEVAVSPSDDRLFVLLAKPGIVRIFSTDIDTSGGAPAPVNTPALGANLVGLVIGSDGTQAYVADSTNKILVIDVAAVALDSTVAVLPANAVISALAIVRGVTDMLAVADSFNKQLHLVGFNPAKHIGSSSALAHTPSALTVSPGGQWVYVLERDGDQSFVQAVSAQKIQLAPPGQLVAPGAELQVGNNSQQLVITTSGGHLYIPYTGDLAVETDGEVAIVAIDETACDEILWRHLEGCPHCDTANCVVLATINNFHLNDRLEDIEDPPTDPVADDTANIARINNRKGRKLLPSTEVLTELVECLLEHPVGAAASQGPVGPQGPAGTSVTSADAVSVAAGQPATAAFNAATGNIHFEIPKGEPGTGSSGTGVVSADAVSVAPGQPATATFNAGTGNIHFEIPKGDPGNAGAPGTSVVSADAVSVAPTQPAKAVFNAGTGNIHFEIPRGQPGTAGGPGLDNVNLTMVNCGTPPSAQIVGSPGSRTLELVIPTSCGTELTQICAINWRHAKTTTIAEGNRIRNDGVLLQFNREVINSDIDWRSFQLLFPERNDDGSICWCELEPKRVGGVKFPGDCNAKEPDPVDDPNALVNGAQFVPASGFITRVEYRVVLKGDLIRDKDGRGVDANHLPPWLPQRITGDGIEGGTFDSWFIFKND